MGQLRRTALASHRDWRREEASSNPQPVHETRQTPQSKCRAKVGAGSRPTRVRPRTGMRDLGCAMGTSVASGPGRDGAAGPPTWGGRPGATPSQGWHNQAGRVLRLWLLVRPRPLGTFQRKPSAVDWRADSARPGRPVSPDRRTARRVKGAGRRRRRRGPLRRLVGRRYLPTGDRPGVDGCRVPAMGGAVRPRATVSTDSGTRVRMMRMRSASPRTISSASRWAVGARRPDRPWPCSSW
jgi:hypothetical protein